jgi:DNA ligase (NAD+)
VPFPRVLFALGIRFVGETVAKKLAMAFKNIDSLAQATQEELVEVEEIGERIAGSVIEFFADERNRQIVEKLKQAGLQFELSEQEAKTDSQLLAGKSFVISGSFAKHSRDEIKQLIEKNGGENSSSISSKTDYLVAGDKIGPSKLAKAEKLEISIISEDDLLNLIQL